MTANTLEIKIKNCSITDPEIVNAVDAIVNPANSYGYMGGGVAGHIKNIGGKEIEKEAIKKAPIKIGNAIITSGGEIKCKVVHSPTMIRPAEKADIESVRIATSAALSIADLNKFKSIAIPGMGTGIGSVNHEEAAHEMINVIKNYKQKYLEKIILVDINKEIVAAWKKALSIEK